MKKFCLELEVSESKLATIISVVSGEATVVGLEEIKQHRIKSHKPKPSSLNNFNPDAALPAAIMDFIWKTKHKRATANELKEVSRRSGFDPLSYSPTVSGLVKVGLIDRVAKGIVTLSDKGREKMGRMT